MADDKKNIGPEVEKTDTTPAPDPPAPGKFAYVAADPSPAKINHQGTTSNGLQSAGNVLLS